MGNQSVSLDPSKNKYFRSFSSSKDNGQQSLVCQRSVPHRAIRQRWENLVIELRNIPNQHIMVPKLWKPVENSLCGHGQVLEIEYENYAGNLEQLIEERAVSHKYFQESEIWYVIYALSEVGLNCRSLGHRVGDIQPSNILMNSEGQIKVMTLLSFPNDVQTFSDLDSHVFFSPQELQQRKKGYMQSSCDAVKSESFAIGLTILSMVLLQRIQDIYNYKSNELNQTLLSQYVNKTKSIAFNSTVEKKDIFYSSSLCDAISLLLARHPDKRLGYTYLYHQLEPHIQQIQEFQPFRIELTVVQEPKDKSPAKEVITLRSRHRKVKGEVSTPSDKHQYEYRGLPASQAPMTESRFVSLENVPRQKEVMFVGNTSLLESIDEKLKRSRQEFPS